ncbi:MAG: hypothetical protein II295_00480, partial [Akkermansia sp.]|nr:hypothetical protein [Akkermansia sp.]
LLTHMKIFSIALALLLGGMLIPESYAATARQTAVAYAADGSKVSLGAICNEVYKAVKEEPEQAAEIYEEIVNQRTTWKASQLSAIFRSILLARPDLKSGLQNWVRTYRGGKNGKDGKDGYDYPEGVPTELCDMFNVLYNASLEDGVPEQTVNEIMSHPGYVPPVPPVPEYVDLIVTPGDTSTSR